jgi:hypothetical protein
MYLKIIPERHSVSSAKVEKFLRLLRNFGTSKVTQLAQLAQSGSEYRDSQANARSYLMHALARIY